MTGRRLAELDEVDSTNAHAHRLSATGERGPLWIRANTQSAGRGRKGRHWVSKPGNLYTTLLITPDTPLASLSQLSFVTSLAVHDLAAHVLGTDADLSLKWPNDVLLKGHKLSGILAETIPVTGSDRVSVAIGCGINLQHAPQDTRYGATCLADHGAKVEPHEAWPHYIDAFSNWLEIWSDGRNFNAIRQAWTDRSRQIGTSISLDLGGKIISGLFQGLSVDGALVLETSDGATQLIRAGDVIRSMAVDR
ncbi:MAG: biotin--[acetyl-CoA-carboxylase] ligase [Hyphomicrobiales bacterium]|nr:biotin--[acetyl-CoA-carboxylase] ligase [Hyphomicrobiales bacterium]